MRDGWGDLGQASGRQLRVKVWSKEGSMSPTKAKQAKRPACMEAGVEEQGRLWSGCSGEGAFGEYKKTTTALVVAVLRLLLFTTPRAATCYIFFQRRRCVLQHKVKTQKQCKKNKNKNVFIYFLSEDQPDCVLYWRVLADLLIFGSGLAKHWYWYMTD